MVSFLIAVSLLLKFDLTSCKSLKAYRRGAEFAEFMNFSAFSAALR